MSSSPRPPSSEQAIRTYDFRRPDKFSKDQLSTLRAIHENFARQLAGQLTARWRSPVGLAFERYEQMIYDEFVETLPPRGQHVIMAAEGLAGQFMLSLDLAFIFAYLVRQLGGPGSLEATPRDPTPLEVRFIKQLANEVPAAFAEAWGHLADLAATVVSTPRNLTLERVAAPSDVVAVMHFRLSLGDQTTWLRLMYPHRTLEPILPRLSPTAWYAERTSEQGGADRRLEQAILKTDVGLRAILGTVELPFEVVNELKVGDTIKLDLAAGSPVQIIIEDHAEATGVPGRSGDRLAIRFTSALRPLEERR